MFVHKKMFNENITKNSNIFLGKKIEIQEKCKLCNRKDELIKCSKCFNYYCKECFNNEIKGATNEIKSEKNMCTNCLNMINNNTNINTNKCFICNKQIKENNFSCLYADKEQKIKLKTEIIKINDNKEISLIEEEEKTNINKEKILNKKNLIKICKECNINYKDLIGRIFLNKEDKEKEVQKNVIDELTNLIKKENGNNSINIFDILENKFEKNENFQKDNIKKKNLFESMVINKEIKKEENYNINNKNPNPNEKTLPTININSNNKTSNIYLPNFSNIAQIQSNQVPKNIFFNQKFYKNIFNLPNLFNNINPQNDSILKSISNQNIIQNQPNNDINYNNNIISKLNNNNISDNKLKNCSENLNSIKEGISNLNNINESNKNISLNNNIDLSFRNTLANISNCLYNFDINIIENNLNIINKIETLTNLFSDLVNEEKKPQEEQKDQSNKVEEKINPNINKNYPEIINNIHNIAEPLKNQLKVLKSYIDTKKIYLSNIYQRIDTYLKEICKDKIDKNTNQILPQSNITNMIPPNNQINTMPNLQGINLLNYMNINGLSNNLLFPLSPILANNNDNNYPLPIFNSSINLPNILAQTRLNSLGNPLFQ